MKTILFSRHFPKGHPKAGQPTCFVNKVWNGFRRDDYSLPASYYQWVKNFPFDSEEYLKAVNSILVQGKKHHTIRAGSRFKPGDMASLRVWSDKPYRSKQIEFAQVEVKKVWSIEIHQFKEHWYFILNGKKVGWDHPQFDNVESFVDMLAGNDGLTAADFIGWFSIHPKKKEQIFTGQIICWDDSINY